MNISNSIIYEVENFHPKIKKELEKFIHKHPAGKRMILDRAKLDWFKRTYIRANYGEILNESPYQYSFDKIHKIIRGYNWINDKISDELLISMASESI